MKKTLWASTNGEIACNEHFGRYAEWELESRPRARRLVTPITTWEKLTNREVAANEWMSCETCGHRNGYGKSTNGG